MELWYRKFCDAHDKLLPERNPVLNFSALHTLNYEKVTKQLRSKLQVHTCTWICRQIQASTIAEEFDLHAEPFVWRRLRQKLQSPGLIPLLQWPLRFSPKTLLWEYYFIWQLNTWAKCIWRNDTITSKQPTLKLDYLMVLLIYNEITHRLSTTWVPKSLTGLANNRIRIIMSLN